MSHEKYKLVKQITDINNTQIASKIRENQKKHYRFNPRIITEGYNFAKSGLTLDDANDNDKCDPNFIYGYEKYIRDLNADGYCFAKLGFSLDDIEDEKKNNIYFIQGYELYMNELEHNMDDPYFDGTMAFLCGMNWECIPENNRQNEAFVQGFEDAMTMSIKRHR